MTLRCREKLTLKFGGQTVHFDPGSAFTVTPNQAKRVLAKFPGKVEVLTLPAGPANEPLSPGWLVVYRNTAGRLCGGADDRLHGTVHRCLWEGNAWMLILTDGQRLPLRAIRSVGKTDTSGHIVAAWDVRGCGFDGEGRRT